MSDVNTTGKIHIESDADTSGFDEATKAADRVGEAAKRVGDLWQDAEGQWSDASGKFASHSDKVKGGIQGINDSADKSGNHFLSLKTIAIGALLDIGAKAVDVGAKIVGGLGSAVVGMVKNAGDFEDKVNLFAAAAGSGLDKAGLSVESFEKQFLDLGKKLPVSTMEVADAATAMVKGGIEPATVAAGGLESTLKFAAAAGMSLEDAANATVSQLAVFTKSTDTAAEKTAFMAEAQNLLVKAAGASKADVAGMSDAILMSAGTAKSAGVDYEDFVTSITMVTDAMPSAAEAGTSFKNMLVSLSPTSKKAVEAFNDLGLSTFNTKSAMQTLVSAGIQPVSDSAPELEAQLLKLAEANKMSGAETEKFMASFQSSAFYDAQGKFIGLRDASGKLQTAFKDLTEADRLRYAQAIFGNDAMGAANVLIDGGVAGYDSYVKKLQEANGVQEQTAATQKGFNFQMEQIKGSLEAIGITIGTKFLPVANKLLEEFVVPAVNGFLGMVGSTDNVGASMDGLVASITPAMDGLKQAFQTAVTWVQENWPAIKQTIEDVVNGIVAFINDPFVPTFNKILVAIQDVVNWVKTNWPLIQPIIEDVSNAIGTVLNEIVLPVLDKVLGAAKSLVEWIVVHWPEIRTAIQPVVDAAVKKLKEIRDMIVLAFDQAANAVRWMAEFVKAIEQGWENTRIAVEAAWAKIETWFGTLPAVLVQMGENIMKGLIEGIKAQGDSVLAAITGVVNGAIQSVKDLLHMKSPSKVFEEIGFLTMAGMQIGIQKGGQSVIAQLSGVVNTATQIARSSVLAGSTAHVSPDASGRGSIFASPYVGAVQDHGDAPIGLTRDDWDAHDRGQPQAVNLVLDGAVLSSVLIGKMGAAMQKDAKRY